MQDMWWRVRTRWWSTDPKQEKHILRYTWKRFIISSARCSTMRSGTMVWKRIRQHRRAIWGRQRTVKCSSGRKPSICNSSKRWWTSLVPSNKNRWRSKTIGFRVSPEEYEQINRYVKLSGLTKQDYITRRLTCKEVVIQGNPRVFKALRDQLVAVLSELRRIDAGSGIDDELLDTIQLIASIMDGMKEVSQWASRKRKRLFPIRLLVQTKNSRSKI